jgi:hypothetical protein
MFQQTSDTTVQTPSAWLTHANCLLADRREVVLGLCVGGTGANKQPEVGEREEEKKKLACDEGLPHIAAV